jgi:ribonucleoside-diphosphate reductase beta chain
MDEGEIFNMYHEVPAVARKASWALKYTREINDPTFKTGTPEADRALLKNLIAYYCVLEGIFFYCGFTQILSMGRRNKMTGTSEQFQYILRDESMHVNFGIDVINQIKMENPHLWDEATQNLATQMILEGTQLEIEYARDTMPRGVLGMNANMMAEYLQFIANRRLAQIGLSGAVPRREEPVPVDERDHGPEEGEELLRDPGDGVSDWGGVELGVASGCT